MKVLENLLYASTHEWVKVEGNVCYVGITDYAQDSLGSIVYVEAYEGSSVTQFSECGSIESVKAASELLSPVSGVIIEVNNEVLDNPELINADPYNNWILKIEMSCESDLENLLNAENYSKGIL